MSESISRRQLLGATVGLGAELAAGRARADALKEKPAMLTRPIPRTQEALPVIGLGTWQTFDVGAGAEERAPLQQVLADFFATGARVIESSPMYGRAEAVVGDLLKALKPRPDVKPFLATKVWTSGKQEGEAQMRASLQKMGTEKMDLMQIHNLLDWRTHLPTLREWKAQGRIRYIGITHYQLSAFGEMERILETEKDVDFVQLPYSVSVREAEKRLLPAAAAHGAAVLVMRPFEAGGLLRSLGNKPLPKVATELGCTGWAQLLLKFILGHPAVTCPIPATSNPKHLADNLKAGFGRLPTEAERKQIVQAAGL